jgi:23S rRNA (uracil1939-C5)-methyltransferase
VLEVGFAARKAHHVVAIDRCPVLAPGLDGAIEVAWAIAEALTGAFSGKVDTGFPQKMRPNKDSSARKPLDIQVTATDAGIDVDVRGSGPLTSAAMNQLVQVAEGSGIARLTRHGEMVIQRAAPTVRMGRAHVTLPPGAFLQATAAGEAALAGLVGEHCGPAKAVADLFCGIGPFALRLAERARITAADDDLEAIAALQRAAAMTSGLKPIAAQRRDLFRRPLVPAELAGLDAVVFDPPRQGAQAQARELASSAVPTVIAVSCNPQTFARDARILVDGGYRLIRVTPVDQFLYAAHIELVAHFSRADGRRRTSDKKLAPPGRLFQPN